MNENPLKQYFRRPAIHVKLPSAGRFYQEGTISVPESGELPVYPMTAIDDITYKTPDALFNGSAVVEVIRSCVPSLIDPWKMLTVDLNVILASIRIASIGAEIELPSTCPECGHEDVYTVDLHPMMENMPDISLYDKPLIIGELELFYRPLTYKEVNDSNKIRFEEAQLANVLANDELPEDKKIEILSTAFKNITKYSIEMIARSIRFVKTPAGTVTEDVFIQEFLREIESDVFKAIKDRLAELRALEDLVPIEIVCDECEAVFNKPFTLDMTSFFDKDS